MILPTKSSCRPPPGYTYLTIGQDLFSISEYVQSQYNYSLHHGRSTTSIENFMPAAAMVYASLASIQNGTSLPTDYGSGVEYADGILNSILPGQGVGLQIGLWLDGSMGCDKINKGEMDKEIQVLIQYLNSCKAAKVFLRIGYEFDNPSFQYSDNPTSYVNAFRYIVNACRLGLKSSSLSNVKFVWHSWAAPRINNNQLSDFYPGDDYVDWVGISVFLQLYPWENGEFGNISTIEEVLNFASLHQKPMMIAESTPFGGINLNNTNTKIYSETDPWNIWFAKVIDLINRFDISMWCYINCDWDSQPMWRGVGFGDTRIASNDEVLQKWHEIMFSTNNSVSQRYLMAGSLGNCHDDLDSMDFTKVVVFIVISIFAYLIWKSKLSAIRRPVRNSQEKSSLLKLDGNK